MEHMKTRSANREKAGRRAEWKFWNSHQNRKQMVGANSRMETRIGELEDITIERE